MKRTRTELLRILRNIPKETGNRWLETSFDAALLGRQVTVEIHIAGLFMTISRSKTASGLLSFGTGQANAFDRSTYEDPAEFWHRTTST
jgi:hypothetical protein